MSEKANILSFFHESRTNSRKFTNLKNNRIFAIIKMNIISNTCCIYYMTQHGGEEHMEFNTKNIKVIAGLAGGSILFAWVLRNLPEVIAYLGILVGIVAPFFIGLCIAFILNVPMRTVESECFPLRWQKTHPKLYRARRPISLVFTILLVIAVIFLVLFIVVPEIARTFQTLKTGIPDFVVRFKNWWAGIADWLPQLNRWVNSIQPEWDQILETTFGFLQNGATSIFQSTMGIATSVFSGILNFFIGIVFAIYVLLRKEILARQSKKMLYAYLPESASDEFIRICKFANHTFSKFISGQCLEAVILGLLFFTAMSIFRFPYAMMISVLIAFTALIPIFGAFIGCAVGVFMILVTDPMQAVWFLVLFLVLQQLENNFIYPRVVGNSVGLPAMWVMTAVILGGSLFGVVGMLIMVPMCSVLYALLRESVNKKLRKKRTPPNKFQ